MHSHLDAEYDARCVFISGYNWSGAIKRTVARGIHEYSRHRGSRASVTHRYLSERGSIILRRPSLNTMMRVSFLRGKSSSSQLFFLDLKLKYALKEKYCQQHSLLSVATWFSMRRSSNFNEIQGCESWVQVARAFYGGPLKLRLLFRETAFSILDRNWFISFDRKEGWLTSIQEFDECRYQKCHRSDKRRQHGDVSATSVDF